jgi:hypothetical protein
MKIIFRVRSDAATFIRNNRLRSEDGREMVVQLYAFHELPNESTAHIRTVEQATEFAEANMASVPSNATFRWAVGSNFRDSVRSSDIHSVNGIPFHLTENMNRMIGDRELILDNGKLRFEPDFQPFSKLPLDP